MVAGRYFDGTSSRARAARLTQAQGLLTIAGDDFARTVPVAALDITLGGSAPSRIAIAGGGVCELADTPESRALLAALGAALPAGHGSRMPRGALIGAAVLVAVLMLAAWKWGIPVAADRIVDRMPVTWDQRLGDALLRQLDDQDLFRPSALSPERRRAIAQRFYGLDKPARIPAYRIEFRRLGAPNAFALPGGAIVLGDELVALAPGDDSTAVMTVLAHELGHLEYRHGMRGIVRATLFSAVAAWYLGDISSFVASAAAGFTALSYSRDAEHSADLYALALMQRNRLETHSAAQLFQRLADWQPEAGQGAQGAGTRHLALPEYLSTHPDTRGRIALFESGPAAP